MWKTEKHDADGQSPVTGQWLNLDLHGDSDISPGSGNLGDVRRRRQLKIEAWEPRSCGRRKISGSTYGVTGPAWP